MKRLLLVCVCCGFIPSVAVAGGDYERWPTIHDLRGSKIELIRVANQKPLVATEETDADVASILKEAEALDEDTGDHEKAEDSP